MLRFLLVRQAAKAKEPTGDLEEGLQLGGAGHLISGKTPIFSMVTLIPNHNSEAVLLDGPFPECFGAQHLSAGLRDAENQDYKPSASVPSLLCPSLLQSFPWPTPRSHALYLESFVAPGWGGTARGKHCLCCSKGRPVKRTGMHMHSADACGRNEGDDVSAAQAEAVDNCQTTTSLPSTRKLDFFPEAPNMAKFVHIFFKEN